jgi:hypothetical protein
VPPAQFKAAQALNIEAERRACEIRLRAELGPGLRNRASYASRFTGKNYQKVDQIYATTPVALCPRLE